MEIEIEETAEKQVTISLRHTDVRTCAGSSGALPRDECTKNVVMSAYVMCMRRSAMAMAR